MPARSSYRRSNRRYYKRSTNKRKFSRFNTYRNRSSKAQAYQIYSLNKKINHVYKMNKPEVQVYQSTTSPIYTEVVTDTLNGRTFSLHRCIDHGLGIFNGRIARLKNVTLTGSFKFAGNPAETEQGAVGCLRLVFFRPIQQIWALPSLQEVLPYQYDEYTNDYYMRCPLSHGFSVRYKLVGDYKFYLYPQKSSMKFINLRIKYPYSLRRADDLSATVQANNAFPANSLFCVSYICRTGEYQQLDTFNAELFMKLAYTDDVVAAEDNRTITRKTSKESSTSDTNECKNDDSNDTVYPTST